MCTYFESGKIWWYLKMITVGRICSFKLLINSPASIKLAHHYKNRTDSWWTAIMSAAEFFWVTVLHELSLQTIHSAASVYELSFLHNSGCKLNRMENWIQFPRKVNIEPNYWILFSSYPTWFGTRIVERLKFMNSGTTVPSQPLIFFLCL